MDARETQYTVVGISPTFTQFLGAPTVVLPLAELQTLTQTPHQDRAALVTIDVWDGVAAAAVKQDLQDEYPGYEFRTNEEQLQSVLEEQVVVIAAGVTLVVLAVLTGLALTVNLLLLFVYQQREVIEYCAPSAYHHFPSSARSASKDYSSASSGGRLALANTPSTTADAS